jgi:cyanophycinase
MVGGGTENYNDWSDEPYGWFVQAADSGKIINIDASSTASFYPNYFQWLGAAASSHGLQIPNRSSANDSSIYLELISAKGIFIEGGDQWPYVAFWKGTLVEEAIHQVFQSGGAIGGTSAGLAVLGEFVFDARNGNLYPDQVAYNPYHYRVSITDDFLQILPHVFTDSHFHTRARMGRLVPMMARRIQDHGNEDIVGIGLDDNTAFCISPDGNGKAFGEGTVTILHKNQTSQVSAVANQAATFTDISYSQLIHGAVFNILSRQLVDPGPYLQTVGTPPPSGLSQDTTLNGSLEVTANIGEIVITNLTSHHLNAWRGLLGQTAGSAEIPHSIIISKLYDDLDFAENRFVGGMFGVATHPHFAALYIDNNSQHLVTSPGIITVDKLMIVLDGHQMTHTGFNSTLTTNYPGIIAATLHFLGDGNQYDLVNHGPIVSIGKDQSGRPLSGFRLMANYPNPFNPITNIEFQIPNAEFITLKIYDLLGQEVATLLSASLPSGFHQYEWDASRFSSGVYLYQLQAGEYIETRKMVLMK